MAFALVRRGRDFCCIESAAGISHRLRWKEDRNIGFFATVFDGGPWFSSA
jgi:hypothetical protein